MRKEKNRKEKPAKIFRPDFGSAAESKDKKAEKMGGLSGSEDDFPWLFDEGGQGNGLDDSPGFMKMLEEMEDGILDLMGIQAAEDFGRKKFGLHPRFWIEYIDAPDKSPEHFDFPRKESSCLNP